MRRRLRWTLLTVVGLVVMAWAVSGGFIYGLCFLGTNESTDILISRGCLCIQHISFPGISPGPWHMTAQRTASFGWDWRSSSDHGLHLDSTSIPLWWSVVPLAVLIFLAWGPSKSRPGRCHACGYETGSLPVCPECGKLTGGQTSAAPPR